MKKKQYLGEMLIADKLITWDVLEAAIEEGRRTGKRLGRVLVEQGSLSEGLLAKFLKKQLGINVVDINKDYSLDKAMLETLPLKYCKKKHVAPLAIKDGEILVAMADPVNFTIEEEIRFMADTSVKVVFATEKSIFDFLDGKASSDTGYKNEESALSGATRPNIALPVSHDKSDEQTRGISQVNKKASKELSDDAPVVKLLNTIISEAIRKNVSDIHFETYEDAIKLMYRIDGILYEIPNPPPISMQPALISRIKIISRLDISERRLPQDGRIKRVIDNQGIDFRVSALPGYHGESTVLRILRPDSVNIGIQALGFEDDHYEQFKQIIKRPNGIFLVTGPTGSGKTTTLYSALKDLNRPDVKIITAEDPVEYNVAGINQCQIRTEIGLDFEKILKSMLRQAPNVILIGEIRDGIVADIAIQAALTGHLVFSTLHTNDAPSAITRLIDMGVKPSLVASSIQAIMAQRLLRVICKECKEIEKHPDPNYLRLLNITPDDLKHNPVYKGKGCSRCQGTGYKGRVAIFEMLEMNNQVRELAFERAPATELRKAARNTGMRTLLQDGKRKVFRGVTTLSEVAKKTQAEGLVVDV
ncbi:MAG: Flp pilus assembly complex ATPase component TadA [Planctomycetes bacterium]|nr:Flp pilus assembly complex ATPase component TadA [Planctomycetota bacterium]